MGITLQRYDQKRTTFSDVKAPVISFFLNTNAGGGSTSSATFVDYPGPVQKTITKRETATTLLVSGTIGAFKTTAAGLVTFALLINGVDYPIIQFFFNDLGTHRAVPFNIAIAQNLLAGVYTAKLRWKTANNGVSTDSNDIIHIRFDEGYIG